MSVMFGDGGGGFVDYIAAYDINRIYDNSILAIDMVDFETHFWQIRLKILGFRDPPSYGVIMVMPNYNELSFCQYICRVLWYLEFYPPN